MNDIFFLSCPHCKNVNIEIWSCLLEIKQERPIPCGACDKNMWIYIKTGLNNLAVLKRKRRKNLLFDTMKLQKNTEQNDKS